MEKTPKYVKNICKHLTNDAKKKYLSDGKKNFVIKKKIDIWNQKT